ncbi:polymorphic transmembrane cluster 2 transmembrane protein 2 [Biomphalaria pfeifferi]|uniref:Polymorphic transmembrane cluster 2 transmembrane protein 2 n=1 Tax=Biomphalaria pfeifferi TaxID=112525 RepID=A0AAD8FJ41_BIOPF|nr:polymorphic transmembrane cluster 2 transmembrane protein 2 [Biomphalaria pfeifferi]
MKVILVYVFLGYTAVAIDEVVELCRPAQENKSYNFDFILQPSIFDLSEFQILKDHVLVSAGDTDLSFIDYFEFIAKTDVSRASDGRVLVRMILHNVTRRDQGTWSSKYYRGGRLYRSQELNCQLKTFVKPQDVSCQNQLNGGRLNIQCSTLKVFPEAVCVIRVSDYASSAKQELSTKHTHEMFLEGNDSYIRSACHISIDLSTMYLKDLDVDITMYPNVTNTLDDLNYGAVKSLHYKLINAETPLPRDCLELQINETHVLCAYGDIFDTVPEAEGVTRKFDLPLENSKTDIIPTTFIAEGVLGSCELHTIEDVFVTCFVKHTVNQKVASQLMILNEMYVEVLTADETSTFLNYDSIEEDQNVYETTYRFNIGQNLLRSDVTTITVTLNTLGDEKTFVKNITFVMKSEKTSNEISSAYLDMVIISCSIIFAFLILVCIMFVLCKRLRKHDTYKDNHFYEEITNSEQQRPVPTSI